MLRACHDATYLRMKRVAYIVAFLLSCGALSAAAEPASECRESRNDCRLSEKQADVPSVREHIRARERMFDHPRLDRPSLSAPDYGAPEFFVIHPESIIGQ